MIHQSLQENEKYLLELYQLTLDISKFNKPLFTYLQG